MRLLITIILSLSFAMPAISGVLQSEGGRYVFGQIDSNRPTYYMLDTSTGRLWKIWRMTPLKSDMEPGADPNGAVTEVLIPIHFINEVDHIRHLIPRSLDEKFGLQLVPSLTSKEAEERRKKTE